MEDKQVRTASPRITENLATLYRGQMMRYIETLWPLCQPRACFGDHVVGGAKGLEGASTRFAEFTQEYQQHAKANGVDPTVQQQVSLQFGTIELRPFTYSHSVQVDGEKRAVIVSSPLRWVFELPLYPLSDYQKFRSAKDKEGLSTVLLHYSALSYLLLTDGKPKLKELFAALRFPVAPARMDGFADLPLVCISAPARTIRPPDENIASAMALGAKGEIQELLDLSAWDNLTDPMREQFLEVTGRKAVVVLPAA